MIPIMMNSVAMEVLYSPKIHTIKMMQKRMPFMKPLIREWMRNGKNIEKKD